VAIEKKQTGRRHGGSQFVLGSPIRFLFEIDRQTLMQANGRAVPLAVVFSAALRDGASLHDALPDKCTQIVYCVFLQLKVKGALAAETGTMSL
jgi:hypothetical protein